MSCSPDLITAILICSFILCTGCTESNGTAAPATPASPVTLESLVLSPSEVPQNFTLIESRTKNSTDVSRLARDLGWKEGYVVRFTRPGDGERGPTWILQTSTRYPEKNIPAVAELIERQDRADTTMILFKPVLPRTRQLQQGILRKGKSPHHPGTRKPESTGLRSCGRNDPTGLCRDYLFKRRHP